MQRSSQKKGRETTRKTSITTLSFGLLVAVLVLSLVAAIQLAANNNAVYAQTSASPTVTGRCEFDSNGGDPTMVWSLTNLDPSVNYRWSVDDNDPKFGDWDSGSVPSGVTSHTVETTSYVGQSADFRLRQLDPSGDILVAMVTIICAPLTEQFENQGECIREANTNPNSGIKKEDCKAAFKV
jgi:hypothetical protein